MLKADITDKDISHYEGVVRQTAGMFFAMVEEEFEDVCQILRMKAWRALVSFDVDKATAGKGLLHRQGDHNCRCAQCRYVFACIRNQVKDLQKRNRRNWLFIEDVAPHNADGNGVVRDAFEMRYMEMSSDEAFASVDNEFTLPSTLNGQERKVVAMLYLSFDYSEIASVVGCSHREVSTAVKSIKDKMADWRPTTPVELAAAA
jgi:RNA polymerase sigma factor (sigma-70 family)